MMFSAVRIAALELITSSAGIVEKKIRISIDAEIPFSMPVLREALIIESRSVGSRSGVCNIIRREIARQEALLKEAA